jgi:xylulokinase
LAPLVLLSPIPQKVQISLKYLHFIAPSNVINRRSDHVGHIFGNPADPQGYMLLLCYKNGSLAREEQRKKTNAADWTEFNKVLESTPPGNNGSVGFRLSLLRGTKLRALYVGNIGMYYLEPEITPSAQAGTYRFDANDRAVDSFASSAIDGRAIIEGQFMSMFIHASRLGVQTTSLLATGK